MKKQLNSFFFGTALGDNKVLNLGWLLFRLHIGLSIAIHAGFPKLENGLAPGWFVEQVAGIGFTFPSPSFWAALAVWGELVGGLMIALGLFTRFAAAQLAFQFFVIAFLWFDNPEPMTGMYFQQTLFWGFVMIAFGGGGSYSIDKLIMRRKVQPVFYKKAIATSLLVVASLFAFGQTTQNVTRNDFRPAFGKWKGSITYLDYSSGKPFSMPANVIVAKNKMNGHQLLLAYSYPEEPKANGNDTLTISTDGSKINGAAITSKGKNKEGNLEIITEEPGFDGNDNKKATIRHLYTIGKKLFIIRKEVRFDGEPAFIMRNEYKMSR